MEPWDALDITEEEYCQVISYCMQLGQCRCGGSFVFRGVWHEVQFSEGQIGTYRMVRGFVFGCTKCDRELESEKVVGKI